MSFEHTAAHDVSTLADESRSRSRGVIDDVIYDVIDDVIKYVN